MRSQARFIDLQRKARIARLALEKIACGEGCPEQIAEEALIGMQPLENKTQLQGLCGHEPRRRS